MRYRAHDLVGWMLYGGGLLVVLGFIVTLMIWGGAVASLAYRGDPTLARYVWVGPLLIVLGGVAMVSGLIVGRWAANPVHRTARIVRYPDVRVVGRFGESRDGQMYFADLDLLDDEKLRYFVQLEIVPGDIREFECAAPVWEQAGEGMRGDAVGQGRWLSQFLPHQGGAYRPVHDPLLPPVDHETSR